MMLNSRFNSPLKQFSRDSELENADMPAEPCPDDIVLADYVSGNIPSKKENEHIASHVARCDKCFEKTAACAAVIFSDSRNKENIKARTLNRARSIPKRYPKDGSSQGPLKRNKYLIIAGIFFALSFIVKVYFMQFLIAALIFGFKWVMNTASTKALIMIYDTWKQKRKESGDEDTYRVPKKRG